MGCLNSEGQFNHWFGNIHLSGICNRSCYFCIGQHMMALDPLDVLNKSPLDGIDEFIDKCVEKGVKEINVTGTNTDPLLYNHLPELKEMLLKRIPDLVFGIRTNGALSEQKSDLLKLFDKGSITICSFDPEIYLKMMGSGSPPDLEKILPHYSHFSSLKVNVVLGDENVKDNDFLNTIDILNNFNIEKVNLREPYGQSHIGNPFDKIFMKPSGTILGMPYYDMHKASSMVSTRVCYWDVHYVEVESVNLYANGVVSLTYPITKGHDPESGKVLDQSHFKKGRQQEQWIKNNL
jgi:molybdenum cofactor biosynthesis enzyme MoaA